jgi:hypothetical protein
MSKARFRPGSSFGGVCYYPLNAEAKSHVARGRKTVSGDDLADLLTAGVEVQLNVSQYINVEVWVDLTVEASEDE